MSRRESSAYASSSPIGMIRYPLRIALLEELVIFRSCEVIVMSISWLLKTLLLLAAIPVAYLVPEHLIQSGYHVPVGVYIAIMGVVVAATTFINEPSALEKVAWIALITLLMYAEIRNLYVADAEQAKTFTTITSGLQETSTQLESTSNRIEQQFGEIRNRFGEIRNRFNSVDTRMDETSFQSVVLKHGKLRADLAELGDKMGSRLNHHVKTRRGVYEGSHQDPARVLVAQRKEDKRYQQEFEDQSMPQLVNLWVELLKETGEDSSPDRSKLILGYGLSTPDSGFAVLHVIQALSQKLIP